MRPILVSALFLLAATATASAACDVKDARIEESIAAKKQLRGAENKQLVRDLRTLRDAAIVLDTFKYESECERLLTIVKTLTANPETSIERAGDTDEEKAEEVEEAREPKVVEPKAVDSDAAGSPAKAK